MLTIYTWIRTVHIHVSIVMHVHNVHNGQCICTCSGMCVHVQAHVPVHTAVQYIHMYMYTVPSDKIRHVHVQL